MLLAIDIGNSMIKFAVYNKPPFEKIAGPNSSLCY